MSLMMRCHPSGNRSTALHHFILNGVVLPGLVSIWSSVRHIRKAMRHVLRWCRQKVCMYDGLSPADRRRHNCSEIHRALAAAGREEQRDRATLDTLRLALLGTRRAKGLAGSRSSRRESGQVRFEQEDRLMDSRLDSIHSSRRVVDSSRRMHSTKYGCVTGFEQYGSVTGFDQV
ncbi:hypothetical protein BZA77DRAFT_316996 [Pyronema omphalodes]|nr:hypothetical protein BZA77DRAFT_316996 [Pyronema omphalodes]